MTKASEEPIGLTDFVATIIAANNADKLDSVDENKYKLIMENLNLNSLPNLKSHLESIKPKFICTVNDTSL